MSDSKDAFADGLAAGMKLGRTQAVADVLMILIKADEWTAAKELAKHYDALLTVARPKLTEPPENQ